MKRYISLFIILALLSLWGCIFTYADSPAPNDELTIVFTHDLHSHIEPFSLNGSSVGGFARIKTVIDMIQRSRSHTLVLDAGDFSMGTLFQTVFTTQAPEYRLLADMGYDAVAFGNHEFDYGFGGVKDMLSSAKEKEDTLPPILCSNIDYSSSSVTENELSQLNINKYSIFKKGDYTVAVFGLLGNNAVDCAPSSGLKFVDYIESAKDTVQEIKSVYSPDLIICLSHSGTGDSVNDEDIKLAKAVPEINVIISGHTHTVLDKPITEGNTIIVSCGEYGNYIGELTVGLDDNRFLSYNLIEINDSVQADKNTENLIAGFKHDISEYLSVFGFESPEQIVANSPFEFNEQNSFSDSLSEQPLGNLISDAYRYAVKKAEGDYFETIDVAVVPNGVIRSSIDKGYITVDKIFEISSLGIGADGLSGYPLCSVYLTGEELWSLAEIDASVSLIMPEAQLYCSGLNYSANTNRMLLNRVYDCWLTDENGNRIEIEKDKLYRVVSGMYSAKMLGTVNSKSYGLITLTPKNKDGSIVSDFDKTIIHNENGVEVKEWVALAEYLSSFPKGANAVPTVPSRYSHVENRKNISTSFSIKEMFTNWNFITVAVIMITVIVCLIIILCIIVIVRRVNKKRAKRNLAVFAEGETEIL